MRGRGVAAALLAGLLLTGCSTEVVGTATPPPSSAAPAPTSGPAIVVDAADALEKAGAVDVHGTMTLAVVDGDLTIDEPISDVELHLQGDDLIGTRTVDGQLVAMIRTGGVLYERGPAAFWAAAGFSGSAARLADVWVRVPVDPRGTGQRDLSIETLVHQMQFWAGGFDAAVSKGTWAGQDDWELAGPGGLTEVAASGPPYPLHVSGLGSAPGDLVFANFGTTQALVAPPGSVELPSG